MSWPWPQGLWMVVGRVGSSVLEPPTLWALSRWAAWLVQAALHGSLPSSGRSSLQLKALSSDLLIPSSEVPIGSLCLFLLQLLGTSGEEETVSCFGNVLSPRIL